jgi:peptidoglycan/xylan/chitin deacetylase (PgdA/CDA1 family)
MPPTPSEHKRKRAGVARPADPPTPPDTAGRTPRVSPALPGADLMAGSVAGPPVPPRRRSRSAMVPPAVAVIVGILLLGLVLVVVGFAPTVLGPFFQRRAEARAMEASRTAPVYALTSLPKLQRRLVSTATSLTAEEAYEAKRGTAARVAADRIASVSLERYLGVVVHKGDPATHMVAITFDDGPSKSTVGIARDLKAAGARATFFFVGGRARGHWQQQQQVLAAGSEIGSHTWDHERLMNMTAKGFDAQTVKTLDAIQHDAWYRPKLLRAMHGDIDAASVAMAKGLGLVVVNWSVHGNDTGDAESAERIARNALSAGPGDIVLLHETNPMTAEAVPAIIRGLQKRGLKLVTVSELLAASKTFKTERPTGSHRTAKRTSGH